MRIKTFLATTGAAVSLTLVLTACSGPEGTSNGGQEGASDAAEEHKTLEELTKAAQNEGTVTWYSAAPSDLVEELAKAFEEETDIKVDTFLEGGEQILARMEAEIRQGGPKADVVTYSNYAAFLNHEEDGLIASYQRHSANEADIEVDIDFDFVTDTFSAGGVHMVCMVRNTDAVSEDAAPKSWQELTDTKWSGRVATGSPEYAGAAVEMVAALEGELGEDYLDDWGANNVLVVQGFGNSQDLVVSGERDIGTVVGIRAWPAAEAGQPIEVIYPEEGCVNVPLGEAVMEHATNPNAGRLLVNFMLTPKGQEIIAKHGFYPLTSAVEPLSVMKPLNEVTLLSADHERLTDPQEVSDLKTDWSETLGSAQD